MQLYYNTGGSKAYNGNILYQWSGVPGNLSNHYHYTYDNLNRLISGSSSGNYNETGISYDLNGNITALKRSTGTSTLTDDLTYTYTSGTYYTNQAQTIADGTTSDIGLKHGIWNYTYDANGNLQTDPSKGITTNMVYNLLNLPQSIPDKSTTYTYDASGQKLRRVIGSVATDYIGGIEYDNSTSNIAFIQTEEGRAVPNGTTAYNYQYFLTDHLGNSRISFETKTGAAVQVQQDDYYPFGMEILRTSPAPTLKNEYLYNRKELQENTGLYDYGARLYDAVVGRWTTIDPLAELGRRWSPYNYGEDNPIGNIDPDGMWFDVPGGISTSDAQEIASVVSQVNRQKPKKKKGQDDPVNVPKEKKKEKSEPKNKLPYLTDQWNKANHFSYRKAWNILKTKGFWAYYEYLVNNTIPVGLPMGGTVVIATEVTEATAVTSVAMTAGKMGEVIGWGTGQAPEAVQQTIDLTANLTSEQVAAWQEQGVTKEFIEKQLANYVKSIEKAGSKLNNGQLLPRKALMEKILKLWK